VQVAEIMLTWVTVSVPPRMLPPAEPLIEPEAPALEPVDPLPPEPDALEPVEPEPVEPEPVEPEPVEPEPVEPEPDEPVDPALLDPEPDEELEPLGDDELLIDEPLAPPNRPVIITWCPTCCDRFTELSAADRRRSEPPRPLMLPPRPAVDDEPSLPDVEPEAEEPEPLPPEPAAPPDVPAPLEPEPDEPEPVDPEPEADEPEPDDPVEPELEVDAPEPELDPMLDPEPLPIFAFFRTKLPPPAPPPELLADELLVSLLLELVLEPSPRCRQPVAVIAPAVSDADLPVDDVWPLSGVLDVGACAAASAPQNATLLLSVIAHCQ